MPDHAVHLAAVPSIGDVQSHLVLLPCRQAEWVQAESMHHDDDGAPRPRGGQGLLAGLLHQLLGQRRVEEVVEHLLVLGQVVGGVDG